MHLGEVVEVQIILGKEGCEWILCLEYVVVVFVVKGKCDLYCFCIWESNLNG